MNSISRAIELLEPRIAPATLVNPTTATYTDIDGDLVTITTSAGAFVFQNGPNGDFGDSFIFTPANADGGQQLLYVDLTMAGFKGVDFTVSAVQAGKRDGLAAVGLIQGSTLGDVKIDGDLGAIQCGDNKTGLARLSVRSMGRYGLVTQENLADLHSTIRGSLGALKVVEDIKDAWIDVTATISADARIGSISIGGAIIGGAKDNSGAITASGDIGPVQVGGDLIGGDGSFSGQISASGKLGNVTIGGSLVGGSNDDSGRVSAAGAIGAVKIGGNIIGGTGAESAAIFSDTKLGPVAIGGSLLGGSGASSASLSSSGEIGAVTVSHDVKGGAGDESGKIDAGGKLGPVTIGGSLIGGGGDYNTFSGGGFIHRAQVFAIGDIGAVTIGHNLVGGQGIASGGILTAGGLASLTVRGSVIGATGSDSARISAEGAIGPVKIGHDFQGGVGSNSGSLGASGTLAGVTLGGSLIGGEGHDSGEIYSTHAMGSVRIGHDVIGGRGSSSGFIRTAALDGDIAGVRIGGSLIGGAGNITGGIFALGSIASVRIAHDFIGDSLASTATADLLQSGRIESVGRIGSIAIGGSIIAGTDASTTKNLIQSASIGVGEDIGSLTVKGSLVGNAGTGGRSLVIISARGQATPGATSDVAIGNIAIGGRVEFAQIFAGYDADGVALNADAQIRKVSVGGDWVASSIVAGAINLGADDALGGIDLNADNVAFGNIHDFKIDEPSESTAIISKIGSIDIAGQVFGTPLNIGDEDRFGFVAEKIGALKIGGATIALDAAPNSDGLFLGRTGDMALHEIDAGFLVMPLPTASAKLVNASTVTYDDIDGDHVTVKLSKPLLTSPALANMVFKFDTGLIDDGVNARQQLRELDLKPLASDGLGVTITVKPGGGDGIANVGYIDSTGFDLGKVKLPCDLGQIDAGNPNPGGTGLQALEVRTFGRLGADTQQGIPGPSLVSDVTGDLGALTVKQDVAGTRITVTGAIGPVTLGGSLIGGTKGGSGTIVATGAIGAVRLGGDVQRNTNQGAGIIEAGTSIASVTVGGSLIGGDINADGTTLGPVKIAHNVLGIVADFSGQLSAGTGVASVRIGGSLLGGAGLFSGGIFSNGGIGAVKIAHNLAGGAGDESGKIDGAGTIESISIGGSLIGGPGNYETTAHFAQIFSVGDVGAVRIGHDIHGGSDNESGTIASQATLAGAKIGGSLVGGSAPSTGALFGDDGIGPVKIGHDLAGGAGPESGRVETFGKLGAVTVGGSVIGGSGSGSGRIRNDNAGGLVKIGHDLLGGGAIDTGLVSGSNIVGINVGGSVVGGSAAISGTIFGGELGPVKIGRDLIGGSISGTQASLDETGYIEATRIASISIGGSIIAGIDDSTGGGLTKNASIRSVHDIGALSVKGSLIGNVAPNGTSLVIISAHGEIDPVGDKDVAIGKITIGGRVERATILAGYSTSLVPDNDSVQIGAVKVHRDWIASNLVAGIHNLGADDAPGGAGANADNVNFGDAHDTFLGLGSIFNQIASIVIGGAVVGSDVPGNDHFGFSAVQIGSFKSLNFTAPLTPGASADLIELSPITRDVTIREV